uniref:Uncharacterized protein n=1 Tax=Micrurus surinamensis TaxID=129470 RepID=A0A2D4PPT9_MICSU
MRHSLLLRIVGNCYKKQMAILIPVFFHLSDGLFVAGINLTADLGYILTNINSSVKKMALKALPFLNLWVKKQHPGSKKDCINIIAGDFIEKNNFVENVINLNSKLILQ